MSWNKEDFSNYHNAPSAWYRVHYNGKVDIGMEKGRDEKISLQPNGMFKLVKDWLKSGHQLSEEQKQELIDILSTPKKVMSLLEENSKLKEIAEKLGPEGLNIDVEKLLNSIDPLAGINEFTRKHQEQLQENLKKINK
jgi:hypothetical protein